MKIVLTSNLTIEAYYPDTQDLSGRHCGLLVITIPDGTPVEIGQPWEVDLAAAQASACAEIDAEAERRRNTVLTPGSGQMAAYQAKEVQARALLADDTPTEAEYPDIYNEIGLTAGSAGEVAMAVLAAAEKWRAFGRDLERARLAGKKAVGQAGDVAAVVAARDGAVWP